MGWCSCTVFTWEEARVEQMRQTTPNKSDAPKPAIAWSQVKCHWCGVGESPPSNPVRAVILIVSVFVACGCATPEPQWTPVPEPSRTAEAPLAPGDRINMTVHTERGVTTWSGNVDAQGNITLPFAITAHVAGLTRKQAAKKIEEVWLEQTLPRSPYQVHVEISR
jgi:hypothetical protein